MRTRHYWKIGSRKWNHWPDDHLIFLSPSDNNSFRLRAMISIRITCDEVKLCVIKKNHLWDVENHPHSNAFAVRDMQSFGSGIHTSLYFEVRPNPLPHPQWTWHRLVKMALSEQKTGIFLSHSDSFQEMAEWQGHQSCNWLRLDDFGNLVVPIYSSSAMFRAVGKIWSHVRSQIFSPRNDWGKPVRKPEEQASCSNHPNSSWCIYPLKRGRSDMGCHVIDKNKPGP